MKNLNPLKIGKYTFWVSFIIGNIFMFGFLFAWAIDVYVIAIYSAVFGYYYLYVATIVNLVILFALLFRGIVEVDKRKLYIKCISIMLINIPLAILYAFVGIFLIDYFKL